MELCTNTTKMSVRDYIIEIIASRLRHRDYIIDITSSRLHNSI